jgi:hypothetical protein
LGEVGAVYAAAGRYEEARAPLERYPNYYLTTRVVRGRGAEVWCAPSLW